MLLVLARPSPGFCLLRRTVGEEGGCAPELAVSSTDVMALALRSSGQASGICWLPGQHAVTFQVARLELSKLFEHYGLAAVLQAHQRGRCACQCQHQKQAL